MIHYWHVGRQQEERLLYCSPNAGRDAPCSRSYGQTRNQGRRYRFFHEAQSFYRFRMDAPIPTIGSGSPAVYQGSGCQTETPSAAFFPTHPYPASSGYSLWLRFGPVDGASRQESYPKNIRYQSPSQTYAQILAQTGTGTTNPRTSRLGTRPQSGAPVEKKDSPEDHSLLRLFKGNPLVRRRKSLCPHPVYRQNLDFPQLETHRPCFWSARRPCGGNFCGQPKRTSVFPAFQRQLQFQNLPSIRKSASRPFPPAKALPDCRWSSWTSLENHQGLRPRKCPVAVFALFARIFPGTQSQRRSLEYHQSSAAQCQTHSRPSASEESGSWLFALPSKTTPQDSRILQRIVYLTMLPSIVRYSFKREKN